jgi:hypothetical protein
MDIRHLNIFVGIYQLAMRDVLTKVCAKLRCV